MGTFSNLTSGQRYTFVIGVALVVAMLAIGVPDGGSSSAAAPILVQQPPQQTGFTPSPVASAPPAVPLPVSDASLSSPTTPTTFETTPTTQAEPEPTTTTTTPPTTTTTQPPLIPGVTIPPLG